MADDLWLVPIPHFRIIYRKHWIRHPSPWAFNISLPNMMSLLSGWRFIFAWTSKFIFGGVRYALHGTNSTLSGVMVKKNNSIANSTFVWVHSAISFVVVAGENQLKQTDICESRNIFCADIYSKSALSQILEKLRTWILMPIKRASSCSSFLQFRKMAASFFLSPS